MRLTQAQQARVQALEGKDGRISARRVLEDAKQKSSPLHKLYDWNVKRASEKWWLHQTRLIIASVTVKITVNEITFDHSKYVKDMTVKEGYQSTFVMKADSASARESLIFTLTIASGHLQRAYDLAAPLGLQHEIDGLLAQIAGVIRIVKPAEAA